LGPRLRQIGLFGGSFDPPHKAHLAFALAALNSLQLDEVRWIPAGLPWQKSRPLSAPAHREAMVMLAIECEPRFVLECCELRHGGPSYTLDTVRELQARVPPDEFVRWVLLIGQDQYANFHTWNGWQELLSLVTLAVASRPGVAVQVNEHLQDARLSKVNMPMMDVSSTLVRACVAQGKRIDDLVPEKVASYIARQGLYRV
jgi:nicotinate-nucleotide adenylyltransferase